MVIRLFILSLSVLMMMLSLPVVFAELNNHIAQPLLAELQGGGNYPETHELEDLISAKKVALSWQDRAQDRIDLAFAFIGLATRHSLKGADRKALEALENARSEVQAHLRLHPASGAGWYLLSRIYFMFEDEGMALDSMARSYRAVPLDIDQIETRGLFALHLMPYLDDLTINYIAREFAASTVHYPQAMARLAIQSGRLNEIEALLEAQPEQQAAQMFQKELQRQLRLP